MASMVVIFWPTAAEMGVTHERTGAPFRCTVQAPHSAWPQPNLVPVMPSVSRRAQRMGVESSALTAVSLPLMFKVGIVRFSGGGSGVSAQPCGWAAKQWRD